MQNRKTDEKILLDVRDKNLNLPHPLRCRKFALLIKNFYFSTKEKRIRPRNHVVVTGRHTNVPIMYRKSRVVPARLVILWRQLAMLQLPRRWPLVSVPLDRRKQPKRVCVQPLGTVRHTRA